jgi:hypothetical protein
MRSESSRHMDKTARKATDTSALKYQPISSDTPALSQLNKADIRGAFPMVLHGCIRGCADCRHSAYSEVSPVLQLARPPQTIRAGATPRLDGRDEHGSAGGSRLAGSATVSSASGAYGGFICDLLAGASLSCLAGQKDKELSAVTAFPSRCGGLSAFVDSIQTRARPDGYTRGGGGVAVPPPTAG